MWLSSLLLITFVVFMFSSAKYLDSTVVFLFLKARTLPGVSFPLKSQKYVLQFFKQSTLLYLFSSLLNCASKKKYCTCIGTYCVKSESRLRFLVTYSSIILSVGFQFLSSENLRQNFNSHFLWSPCVSDPHGASLTGCCIFRCAVPLWNQREGGWLNAKQLQLPQHQATGCLYCCYYGDMPLHSVLYNKV